MKKLVLLLFLVSIQFGFSQWESCNNGMYGKFIDQITALDSNIIAQTNSCNIMVSHDLGDSWTEINLSQIENIECFAHNGKDIFAGTYNGNIYVSSNFGDDWKKINNWTIETSIKSIAASDSIKIASTNDSILFLSTDYGNNWTDKIEQLEEKIYSLLINGKNIIASSYNKLYLSADYGKNWSELNIFNDIKYITCLIETENIIFAGTNNGLYLSTDNGLNWSQTSFEKPVTNIVTNINKIFINSYGNGLFYSSDRGITWSQKNGEYTDMALSKLAYGSNKLIAGTWAGVYISSDDGNQWISKNSGLSLVNVWSFNGDSNNIYAGTNCGLFVSSDNGTHWEQRIKGLEVPDILKFYIDNKNIYAILNGSKEIYRSTDLGNNWLPFFSTCPIVNSISAKNNKIVIATEKNGILVSLDDGLTWVYKNNGLLDSNIFFITFVGNNICAESKEGLYISTDNGDNWKRKLNFTDSLYYNPITVNDNIIITTDKHYIYKSTDYGENWSDSTNSLSIPYRVDGCLLYKNNIYLDAWYGNFMHGYFLSTDYGKNWTIFDFGSSSITVEAFIVNKDYIMFSDACYGAVRAKLSDIISSDVQENKPQKIENIQIFPNPANDFITINLNNYEYSESNITILNPIGIEVKHLNIHNSSGCLNIDIKDIPAGVYFLRIGNETKMFVKE
jgi:photosystem II stability/assembly factor-like uncharacterized protein